MLNVAKRKEEGLKIMAKNTRYYIDSEDLLTIKNGAKNWVEMVNTAFLLGVVQGRKIGMKEGKA